jgi:hypothetical protein
MSDTPIPAEGSFEANAVEKLVQTAWDRFATLGNPDNVEGEDPDEKQDLSSSDGAGHEGDD